MSIEPRQDTRYAPGRARRWRLRTVHHVVSRAATAGVMLGAVMSPGPAYAGTHVGGARLHVVRMLGDAKSFRFEPDHLEIASGDTLVFEVTSGQPHDVAFDTVGIAPAAVRQLSMRLHDQIAPLAGPLLVQPGERYVVSFDGIAPGRYEFYCLPHQAVQMKGWVVVK